MIGPTTKQRQKIWFFWGVLLLVIGVVGAATGHLPFLSRASAFEDSGAVFEPSTTLTYEQAQETYRKGLDALKQAHWEEAVTLFDSLEGPYIRLRPMIRIHEAEAYAEMGEESKAQDLLNRVIASHPDTMFDTLAQYRLGQSAMRSNEEKVAEKAFTKVIEQDSKSSMALGSHYYLGQLADKAHQNSEAATQYRAYLKESTDGTFSLIAAKALERIDHPMIPEDHLYAGKVYFENDDMAKAVAHLKQAPFEQAWLDLGKATLKQRHYQEGLAILDRGLRVGEAKPEEAQDAIRQIYWSTPSGQRVPRLKTMLGEQGLKGKDFVLWQLEQLSSGPAQVAYAKQLADQYPNSDWAPESSWMVTWNAFQTGHRAEFLEKAQHHLERFPYSRSAPKAMFWMAKSYEKSGNRAKALEMYHQVAEKYPHQFYAYRAEQIVKQIDDPWHTSASDPYPPSDKTTVDSEALARYIGSPKMVPVTAELIHIGAASDVSQLAQLAHGDKVPPPLDSWVLQNQHEYAKSIRTIRDYLDDQRKKGKPVDDPNLYKLLYPVLFSEEISQYAHNNHLDPYLVQALARQESYFNPMAVSSSNAIGLMQLLPSTARDVAKWENLSDFTATSLFQPGTNIRLGSRYLRFLHDRFNGNSMLSVGAYNGGPGAMSRWSQSPMLHNDPDLFIESIPYAQSRDYIKEVYSHYWNYQELYNGDTRLTSWGLLRRRLFG